MGFHTHTYTAGLSILNASGPVMASCWGHMYLVMVFARAARD
jgi:hypothetical protein